MPLLKLLGLAKKAKAVASPTVVVDISVTVAQTVTATDAEALRPEGLAPEGDVHVRMTFDENGVMTIYQVEHLEVAQAAPAALSNATTLVGSPTPSKPASPSITEEERLAVAPVPSATVVGRAEVKKPATTEVQPALARALTVEDFRIIRVLGEGGQGVVSLVQDKATDKLYALKAIKKHTLQTKDLPTVFVEQNIMKTLSGSPFFTSLKGSFEDEDHFFLLTDYLSGGDLNDRLLKEGKLSTEEARLYSAQILLAMAELRRHRIVHRDLKPKNILLNAQNEAIISDFGLSRTFGRTTSEQPWRMRKLWQKNEDQDDLADAVPHSGAAMDKTQATCGTFGYMAPELFTGDHSYEVDVWAYAATLYEMLHGKLPFGFEANVPSMELVSRTILEDVEVGHEVDPDAADLLLAMFAKDPLRRPTWEQIKEHPWFDPIDWDRIACRQPASAPIAPKDLKPDPHARYVMFGEPLADGETEYPFFHWVAPELAAVPTVVARTTETKPSKWRSLFKADKSQSRLPKEASASFTLKVSPNLNAIFFDIPRASRKHLRHTAFSDSRQAPRSPMQKPFESVEALYTTTALASPSRSSDGLYPAQSPSSLWGARSVGTFAPDKNGYAAVAHATARTGSDNSPPASNAKLAAGATTTAAFDAILSDPWDSDSMRSFFLPDATPGMSPRPSNLSRSSQRSGTIEDAAPSAPADTSDARTTSRVSDCSFHSVALASIAVGRPSAHRSRALGSAPIPLDANDPEAAPSLSSATSRSSSRSGSSCTLGSLTTVDAPSEDSGFNQKVLPPRRACWADLVHTLRNWWARRGVKMVRPVEGGGWT